MFFTNMPTNAGLVQYQAVISDTKGGPIDKFAGPILNRKELRDKLVSLGYPDTVSPESGSIPSNFSAVDPKFKMPQVWKTSLAFDYSFPTSFPFSVSAEGIYNKTINAVRMRDRSFKDYQGFARFNGADNRPIFKDAQYTYVNSKGKTVSMPNAYILENTDQGYGWSASLSMNMTPVKGLNIMAAYTHTVSKEITGMPGSNAASTLDYYTSVNGFNDPGLHNSMYTTPDRVVASLTHSDKSGNQVQNNEFRFVSEDDRDRFMDFVHKDKYLSKHQGKYTEGYSVYNPWVHRLDFSYKHDFKLNIGKSTNTLQLSLDVKNILNFFNSSWGVIKHLNPSLDSGRILEYKGVDKEGYPTFATPAAVNKDTQIYTYYQDASQCWYASIGIKYMFN